MPAAETGIAASIACAVISSFNTIYLPADVALRDGIAPADASIAVLTDVSCLVSSNLLHLLHEKYSENITCLVDF